MPGTLFIIATPIGNLEDLTFRAVRILGECGAVACEDTRQTRKLLDHYGIRVPTVSLHEHNETERASELCDRMLQGEDIALASDAGTPLISDPGYRLVTRAIQAGVTVRPIPGASAVTAAISAAGLPTDRFCFRGFLPPKQTARRAELKSIEAAEATTVYYEAPHRIVETLRDIAGTLPDHPVAVARELTKVHEEFLRGSAEDILRELESRPSVPGEITLLIGKAAPPHPDMTPEGVTAAVEERISLGMPRMDAIKAAARDFGVSKSAVYRILENK